MDYKFSVTINNKRNSLNPRNGLDIKDLGNLIEELKKAIDADDGSYCTLYKISNHGYTPNFLTNSKKQYENFISVHQNIYERPLNDLRNTEIKYAQTLKSILHGGRFLESFGLRSKPIVKIFPNEIERSVDSYYSITNVVGIVTEMGSQDFKRRTHIYLHDHDYKIYTNHSQDEILKQFYRTKPITLKVKQKKSIKSDRIISSTLIDFSYRTNGNLTENIKSLSSNDVSFLANAKTHEDILTLIRS